MFFNEDLILVGKKFNNCEESLVFLSNHLKRLSYVNASFAESILEREKKYPTGLPTKSPYGIAIPHTEGDFVNRECICLCLLEEQVSFHVMGNSGETVDVNIIFMLALKDPEKHLKLLQRLIHFISDNESIETIIKLVDKNKIIKFLNDKLLYDKGDVI